MADQRFEYTYELNGKEYTIEGTRPPTEREAKAHAAAFDRNAEARAKKVPLRTARQVQGPPAPPPRTGRGAVPMAPGVIRGKSQTPVPASVAQGPVRRPFPQDIEGETQRPAGQGAFPRNVNLSTAVDAGIESLPMVGGMIGMSAGGGITAPLGGWGGPIGAGIGAAGGKGARDILHALRYAGTPEYSGPRSAEGVAGGMMLEGGLGAVGEGAGTLAARGLTNFSRYATRKIIKPSLAKNLVDKADEIPQTILDRGINSFTPGRLNQLDTQIGDIGQQVQGHISGGPIAKPLTGPDEIANRLTRVQEGFAGSGADPADRAAVRGVRERFLADQTDINMVPGPPGLTGPEGMQRWGPTTIPQSSLRPMSPDDLYKARGSTYKSFKANAVGANTSVAKTEAEKELYHHLGRGLREAVPATGPLMAEQNALLDVLQAGSAAQNRALNAPFGSSGRFAAALGTGLAAGGAGYANSGAGGGLGAAGAGFLAGAAITSPRALQRGAIQAYRAGQMPGLFSNVARGTLQGTRLFGDPAGESSFGPEDIENPGVTEISPDLEQLLEAESGRRGSSLRWWE